MAQIHDKIAYAHASADTESLHGLVQATWKLGYDRSHGKVYAWIDSSASFLKNTVFSVVHLVNHLAFAVIGLLGIVFQSGRRFLVENLLKSGLDLVAIPISLVGTIYPWLGANLTGKLLTTVNSVCLKKDAVTDKEIQGKVLGYPLYLVKYVYAYMQRSHVLLAQHFGGEKKLVKAANA